MKFVLVLSFVFELPTRASSGERRESSWRSLSSRFGTPAGEGTFSGLEPNGSAFAIGGLSMVRIDDTKFAEVRGYLDRMSVMEQLGIVGRAEERAVLTLAVGSDTTAPH